jgi:hypothetical protein
LRQQRLFANPLLWNIRLANDRIAPKAAIPAKSVFWHETEMPLQSPPVRYREQSGRHLLAASISPF